MIDNKVLETESLTILPMKVVSPLILIICFFGSVSFAQKTIEQVDFDNFTYQTTCFEGIVSEFKLKNGKFFRSTLMADGNLEFSITLTEKRYLDTNADERKDAVILLSCKTTSRPETIEGFVYTFKKNKLILLTRIKGDFASFGKLSRIEVKDKTLVVTFNYRNFANIDSTNQYFQFLYKWVHGKLEFWETNRISKP
jgi:hypothetical protein